MFIIAPIQFTYTTCRSTFRLFLRMTAPTTSLYRHMRDENDKEVLEQSEKVQR
jgi:hypothetical protein